MNSELQLLTFYYQNIRGLRTKTKDFFLATSACDYDIIALTETWLTSSFHDSELFENDFIVFRCDRSLQNSKHEKGGGVLIAVRLSSHYTSERLLIPGTENVEIVFVKIHVSNNTIFSNIFLCCLYIPSGSSDEIYNCYMNALTIFLDFIKFTLNDVVVIIGDFNFPGIDWITDTINDRIFLPVNVRCGIQEDLINNILCYGLSQINPVKNHRGRLLDLFFSNFTDELSVKECSAPLLPIDIEHVPIEISLNVKSINNIKQCQSANTTAFNFKRANFNRLNVNISSVDWLNNFKLFNDINSTVDYFYMKLFSFFENCVPRLSNKRKTHPPWYNRSVMKLKNLKSKAYKRYKKSKLRTDYTAYSLLRNAFNTCQSLAYKDYLTKTQSNLTADPSQFWKYVNSKKQVSGFPNVMSYKNVTESSVEGICNLFSLFFKDVYVDNNIQVTSQNAFNLNYITSSIDISSIQLTRLEVLTALQQINVKKGNGPDYISPLLLRECAESLATPLTFIFNQSLAFGIFPNRWKISHITPIFKSGSRSSIENYRGIAILPTLGKLFEFLVCNVLSERVKNIIGFSQHGFMRGRSANTNLIEFTNYVLRVIESGSQLDVLYTDFSKAFDRVQHNLLINKLNHVGIHGNLLAWIQSYLSTRYQLVKICGWKSSLFPVLSGVPQGSHLGPLLFILYINDVQNIFDSSCLLYADDLKIFCPIDSNSDALRLQKDLDKLALWCEVNSLYLNVKKCKCMSFHRKRNGLISFDYNITSVYLERVNEMLDLGILFDEKVTFTKHIDCSIAKAYSMLGFVMRICADFNNPLALKCLYFAHVRTHLEYGLAVWYPYYEIHVKRIESIQKRFVWFMFCKFGWQEYIRFAPYFFKCNLLNLDSLSQRRRTTCCLLMCDLLTGRIDAPNILSQINFNVPPRPLRQQNMLRLQHHRTNYGTFEPINNLSSIFNDYSHLFEYGLSRTSFRNRVRSSRQ